jgi:hypothetical protein
MVCQRERKLVRMSRNPTASTPYSFARKRQMHTDIEHAVVGSHLRRFREPGTGHHDRAGATSADRRELSKGRVGAMGHRDLVFVNHN